MSFKIVLTVALAFLCGVIAQENNVNCDFPDKHPENCDTSSFLSHLTCRESGQDCTCFNGDLTPCDEVTVTYEELTAEQCKTLCEEDTATPCRFYKHTSIRGKKECYLMSEDQCATAADGGCVEGHCDSGYVLHDDEQCEDNTGGGDDGIIDKTYTCPTGSKQETSIMPDNYLKWTCYDMHHQRVNIYENGDENAPGGTHCYSRPEGCGGKDYEYTCDGGDEGSDQGVWKIVGDEDPEAVDEATNALKDVICNAPDLVLNKAMYDQTGLEIQCVEVGGNEGVIDEAPEAGPTVKAQGNCLLLCDWYPILNFYTRDDTWYWKEMDCGAQDCPEEVLSVDPEVNKDVIYCWKEEAPSSSAAPTSSADPTSSAAPETSTTTTTTTTTPTEPEEN